MADEQIIEEVTPETPVVDEKTALDNSKNPERTKEFIDKLKEERDQYKNLFEGLKPADITPEDKQDMQIQFPNVNTEQVNNTLKSVVDENGYLDGNKLAQTLQSIENRASKAEKEVQEVKKAEADKQTKAREREEKKATLEVYEKYPQMDPNNVDGVEKDGEVIKFDPKMWQYVYNELAVQAKQGTMPSESDYMTATDKIYTDLYEGRNMTKKEEQIKVEDQKRNINATRPRSTIEAGYFQADNDDALVSQIRSGKRGAVAEALRRRGL